ncbi:multidrug effflux MFS transporter [Ignatzschineria sp. RMDPL8A]|uniref:multidrug effflux MFS transporter n=1 Tax=Ignatzschineria sp. RMDPL8A TaxID=2999236 RepID=UPI0024466A9E|nr:multidrug effflux MFS transporter [Ignatzschineria sp. RMDPL8A]MDG9730442.1 multidrug effflux MFS transporter [Ignatzschineria sp. RMDPL8A]
MIQPKALPAAHFLVAILTLMAAFGPLSIDLYLPAFLQIQEGLNADPSDVKRTLTTFLTGLCIGMMFYGSLSDKYGRRKLVLIGSVIYTATSIISAFATSIEYLIYARFFQAIGAGACMVVGRAIIRDVFSGKKVAMMMSVVQVILMIAPLAAPFIGVQVLKLFDSWRALFWLLAFFGIITFLSTLFFLPETYKKEDRQEVSILGTFYNYIRILKKPDSLGSILGCALPSGFVFAYITGSPHLYQQTYGVSEQTFSLLFGINIIGVIISALLNIVLLRRFSVNSLIMFGLSWMAVAGVITFFFADYSLISFLISIFLLMCVSGFVGNNLASKIIELNYHQAGAAMALNSASQFMIGSIASFIVGHNQALMVPVMAFCGISALFAYLFLVVFYQKRHAG